MKCDELAHSDTIHLKKKSWNAKLVTNLIFAILNGIAVLRD